MPGPVDMPLIISQLANVQQLSNAEMTKAQMQQSLVINPTEQEHNKEAQKQIQNIEKDEDSQAVGDRDGGSRQDTSPRKRNKKESEAKDEVKTKPSPWSGNIINVKI